MIAEPIRESGITFGFFEEDCLFKIEHSDVHQKAGEGIKSVEFIYLSPRENLLFVEAKSSCPNAANREESEEKKRKYEEFFKDVTDKFIDSINMFAATILGRNNEVLCMG